MLMLRARCSLRGLHICGQTVEDNGKEHDVLSVLTRATPEAALRRPSGRWQSVVRWMGEATYAAFGPTQAAAQRQDVLRRALISAVIIAVLPIQQMRIPGWPGVVGGCVVALVYNLPLAYMIFKQERFFFARVLGLVLDALVLMGASLYVFREMGAVNSTPDIWMVFLVYILIGGFTLAPIGSLLYTALWIGWFALGTLLYFPADSQFNEQLPVRIIFFAVIGLVALASANELDKRRKRLEQQNRQTLGMMAKLVEARDTDAGAHLHRIQFFSRALAVHLGFSQREAQEIAYASMIHDVGKAYVPDSVLQEDGPLNAEQWRIMKNHTVWGDHLLAENSDFDTERQVVRWHHEHWDGSGYPDGLAGYEIPYAARIVAVADVYDALISKRPYKEAWPTEKAMREIQRIAGTHLDPLIVPAFIELWEQGVIDRIADEIRSDEAEEHMPIARAA